LTHDLAAPRAADVTVPNAARMYDHYLGGDNNFPVDRDAAEHVLRVAPWIRTTALENRAFLGRAVRYLAREAGIRQFVDIGTGLPTRGSVHEAAREAAPDAHVVYADIDPIVVGQARAILSRTPGTAIVRGDLRQPEDIIASPELTALIDWRQPVALLLVAVLHFVAAADDPGAILARFRRAMAPGSYVAITHLHHEPGGEAARQLLDIYQGANVPLVTRTREEITALFDGLALVDPGVVSLPDWRPEPRGYPAGEVWGLAGIGRIPAAATDTEHKDTSATATASRQASGPPAL
jgi:hypothetical protein